MTSASHNNNNSKSSQQKSSSSSSRKKEDRNTSNNTLATKNQKLQQTFESDLAFDSGLGDFSAPPTTTASSTAASSQQQSTNVDNVTTTTTSSNNNQKPENSTNEYNNKDVHLSRNDRRWKYNHENQDTSITADKEFILAERSIQDIVGQEKLKTNLQSFVLERNPAISVEDVKKLELYQAEVKKRLSGKLAKFWKELDDILPLDGTPLPKSIISTKITDKGWNHYNQRVKCFDMLEEYCLARVGRANVEYSGDNARMWKYRVIPGLRQPPRGLGVVGPEIDYKKGLDIKNLPEKIELPARLNDIDETQVAPSSSSRGTGNNNNNNKSAPKRNDVDYSPYSRYIEAPVARKRLTRKEREFLGEVFICLSTNDRSNLTWQTRNVPIRVLLNWIDDRGYFTKNEVDDIYDFLCKEQFLYENVDTKRVSVSFNFLKAVDMGSSEIPQHQRRRRSRSPLQQQQVQQQQLVYYPQQQFVAAAAPGYPLHQQIVYAALPPQQQQQQFVAYPSYQFHPLQPQPQQQQQQPTIRQRIILAHNPIGLPPPLWVANGVARAQDPRTSVLYPPPFFPTF